MKKYKNIFTGQDIIVEGVEKLEFKNDRHKHNFEAVYNAKKKTKGADRFEISEPYMIKVMGKNYPGFDTSYRNKTTGKTMSKVYAIDENGYDVYVPRM